MVCGRCRNCMAGRRHLCAHTIGLGVNRPGAFAEYVALPMTNIWHHWPGIDEDVASIFDPFGNAVHTALSFPVLGEDVLITGAGPDRLHGGGGRAPRRRAPRRRHRPEPLPARAGPPDGRDGGGRPARARARRRAARARHDRGLRRRPRDVGQPRRAARDARQHGPRRPASRCSASPPREIALDLNPVIFNMLTIKGIYGREMYETWYQMTVMLQSGLDISAGDHAPLLAPRLRGGVRRRPLGAVGQGHPRLDRHLEEGADRVRSAARRTSSGRSPRCARPGSTRPSS